MGAYYLIELCNGYVYVYVCMFVCILCLNNWEANDVFLYFICIMC